MPKDCLEQIKFLPKDIKERNKICFDLMAKMNSALDLGGIKVERIEPPRVKSPKDILAKANRRNSDEPQRDIYGIRIITKEVDRKRMAEAIQSLYPDTPEYFLNGMPTIRDYADAEVRRSIKQHFNSSISDEYSALHVNVVFMRPGAEVYDIAEVQIMTPEEMVIYKQTRERYEAVRNS